MVGKLIKNELKAGLHSIAPIYIVTAAVVAMLAVSFAFEILWLAVISIIAVALVGIGIFAVTIISVVNNFNKSMFRDQGYLTFTLPVTSGQLLFAKALCSFIWMLLSYVALIGIFAGIYAYAAGQVDDEQFAMIKILISTMVELPDTATIIGVISFFVTYFFLDIIFLVAEIYFSVSLSNVRPFQKMGMGSAILIFLSLFSVTSVISTLLKAFVPLTLKIDFNGMTLIYETMNEASGITFGIADMFFTLAATVFFFVMSAWLMNHKINLK
ncbi:MAG: hypothetical protein IIW48_09850 [Clostridia bacterium]|nr:hypothetical protein [Clostridia bacterium]